jgi:hypothetical protein
MEGKRILRLEQRRADLRFPLPERFAERVANARIDRLARQAKFLSAHLSTGEVLIMHLGMTGRFTISGAMQGEFHHETGNLSAHDHVVFHMEGGETVTYNDPRRFGFMELWPAADFEAYPRLKTMGPEPLSNGFSAAYLDTVLSGKAAPIKAALLDHRGAWQYLCLRSALPCRRLAKAPVTHGARRPGGKACPRYQCRDRRGHFSRRLIDIRLCKHRRRTRLFPAPLRRL